MAHKANPQRQCIGCRRVRSKEDLLRLVVSGTRGLSYDQTGRKPGRGIYVCPNAVCLRRAFQVKRGRGGRGHAPNVSELESGIRLHLLQDIEHLIARGEKMGYVSEYQDDINYPKGSFIVYGSKIKEHEIIMRALGDASTIHGEGSYPDGEEFARPRLIRGDYPFIRDLLKELNVLERLFSEV